MHLPSVVHCTTHLLAHCIHSRCDLVYDCVQYIERVHMCKQYPPIHSLVSGDYGLSCIAWLCVYLVTMGLLDLPRIDPKKPPYTECIQGLLSCDYLPLISNRPMMPSINGVSVAPHSISAALRLCCIVGAFMRSPPVYTLA